MHLRNDQAGEWLEQSILHGVERARADAPGSDVILAKLAEVLFTEALQRYRLPATARPERLARRRRRRHRRPQPGRPASPAGASVDARRAGAGGRRLAVGTDRSVARYLGQSPMAYLAD